MADFSNPLDQLVVGQSQPAVTANELIDALSQAAFGGRRASTSSALTWGYFGGYYTTQIAHGTLSLTASSTNYIVVARATGVISFSTATTNWNDGTNYARLYLATTSGSAVTDWDDYRQFTLA